LIANIERGMIVCPLKGSFSFFYIFNLTDPKSGGGYDSLDRAHLPQSARAGRQDQTVFVSSEFSSVRTSRSSSSLPKATILLLIGSNNKDLESVSAGGYHTVRSLTILFNIVLTCFILGDKTFCCVRRRR
jgi:hypothetical protein